MSQVSTTKSPSFFRALVLQGGKIVRLVSRKKTADPAQRSKDSGRTTRRILEGVELSAEGAHAVGEMIPVAGGLVKGLAQAVAAAVKRTKQSIQNRDDVQDLLKKISIYEKHILEHRIVEEDEDGWRAELEQSFSKIKERLDQCNSYALPSADAQLIAECSKNIDEYIKFFNIRLDSSTNDEVYRVSSKLDVFRGETSGNFADIKVWMAQINSVVILVDMLGGQHSISFPQAMSRQQFVKISTALYPESRPAALIQRWVDENMFDFCIDGDESGITVLEDGNWGALVQAGSKVVMRAKVLRRKQKYLEDVCPLCGRMGQRSWDSFTCTCRARFQNSKRLEGGASGKENVSNEEKRLIKNIHIVYKKVSSPSRRQIVYDIDEVFYYRPKSRAEFGRSEQDSARRIQEIGSDTPAP